MACANIFDAFKQRAEALQDTIYRRATFQSLMLNAVDRGQYPQGQGLTQTVFEMGNVYPTTDERSWDSYTLATGSNAGACANNFIDYDVGYNELTYSPKRMQLRGPLLCKDEAYFSAFSGQFLTGYVEELGKLVDHELGNHLLTDYMNFTPKAVVTSAFPITAVGAPFTALPAAAGDLSQEALDKAAVHLIQKRATNPDSNGFITMANGGPVFTVSLGMEASQAITHANSDFRQDLRDANPSELFTRLGANTASPLHLLRWNLHSSRNLRPGIWNQGKRLRVEPLIHQCSLRSIRSSGRSESCGYEVGMGIPTVQSRIRAV